MMKLMGFGSAFLVLAISGAAMVHSQGHAKGHHHSHAGRHHHAGGNPAHGHDAAHLMDHYRKRLDLSEQQAAKIKGVLDRLHHQMERLAKDSHNKKDIHNKIEALRSRARAQIRATLSRKQRSQFDQLVAEGHDHAEGQQDEKPLVGEVVKDFAVTDSAGNPFRLESLRRTEQSTGTITVLTFWCSTCGSCRMIDTDFNKQAREYKPKGVEFMMVASNYTETPEQVNRFLKQKKLSFPVLMDSESQVARYFGATATTTTAVVDAEGRLRYYGSFAKADDAVRNLLAGEEVATPQTRPIGCMIMIKPGPREVTDDAGRGLNDGHGHAGRG